MTRRFCDKCGKELREFSEGTEFGLPLPLVRPESFRRWGEPVRFTAELCGPCCVTLGRLLFEAGYRQGGGV